MRKIFTPILYVCGMAAVFGQQLPQFSLFLLNPYGYNPACAGLENSLVLTGVYRKQWTDLAGGPETQHLNGHLPVYFLSSGAGIQIDNDLIGAHRTSKAVLTYSFNREIGRKSLFSAGLSAGFMQYSLDGAKLRAPDGTYEQLPGSTFDHNDPNLPFGKVQAGTAVFEAGLFYRFNKMEMGLAAKPVFSPVLRVTSAGGLKIVSNPHLIGTVAYEFGQTDGLKIKPGLMVKTDGVKIQAEILTVFRWRDNFMTGGAFRGIGKTSSDAIVLLAGMKLNEKTVLAYSYDIPLSTLKLVSRGSHEILLRYDLEKTYGTGKLPPVIYNPRFF